MPPTACEYVVWRVLDREIDWYVNRGGQFERILPQADGTLRTGLPRPLARSGRLDSAM